MTLSKAESVFGFEAEPDSSTKEVIAATYLMGNKDVGTIKVNVDGNGGARLVAVSSTMPFNKVVVTETATNDFAIANIRFAAQPLPEPASILLLLPWVVGLGVSKRRRTKKIDH